MRKVLLQKGNISSGKIHRKRENVESSLTVSHWTKPKERETTELRKTIFRWAKPLETEKTAPNGATGRYTRNGRRRENPTG